MLVTVCPLDDIDLKWGTLNIYSGLLVDIRKGDHGLAPGECTLTSVRIVIRCSPYLKRWVLLLWLEEYKGVTACIKDAKHSDIVGSICLDGSDWEHSIDSLLLANGHRWSHVYLSWLIWMLIVIHHDECAVVGIAVICIDAVALICRATYRHHIPMITVGPICDLICEASYSIVGPEPVTGWSTLLLVWMKERCRAEADDD